MTTRYCLYSGGIYNEAPYTTLYFAGFLSSSKFNTWRLNGTYYEVKTPPFTLKSTRINVTSNNQSSSSSWTFYDDGASTSQTISIPSSTTGAFSVTADAIVADNSMCHFRLTNTNTGSLRIGTFTHVVDMTNDDIQGFFGASHQSTGADTSYYSFAGRSTTESYYQFKTPAGTYDNLGIGVYYQVGSTTRTHRFRKNGANGNQVISATGTGWYEDVTNSDTVVEGDLVNLARTTPDSNEWRIQHFSTQFTPTANRAYATGAYGINVNFNETKYAPLGYGGSFTATTVEAEAQNIVKEYAQRLRNLRIVCPTNTITTSSSTCKIRKNGADGNQVISIPASTTGTYEDTTNIDLLAIDDLFCTQFVAPNTSGNIIFIPSLITDDLQTIPQVVRPDGDQSDGNWLNSAGNNTDMYSYIDEAVANDSDYIESEVSPSNSDCEVTLANPTDPLSSTGHIVRYRYRRNNTNSPINITVYLVQGTTVIASNTHTGVSDAWTDGTFTLSGAEADSITNYNDLRLRFRAHESSAPSAQIIRPDGDISAGGWTPSAGTTLWETIDEVTSSDADYDTTANNPSADAFTVSLSNPTAAPTVDTGHTLNYRYGASLGARVIEVKVALMQGAVVIREATHSAVGNGFFDGTFTLTTGEAANITDYNDLRVRVTANTTGGGSPSQARFAWVELQLPIAGSKGQISWAEFEVPESGVAVNTKDVTFDAILKKNSIAKNVTFDSALQKKSINKDVSFDSVLVKVFNKDVNFDSVLATKNSKDVSFDSILKKLANQKDISFDSVLEKQGLQKDVSFDSVLVKQGQKDVSFDAILQKANQKDVNFDSILQTSNQKDINFDSILQSVKTKDVTFDVALVKQGHKDVSFDTVLQGSGQKDVNFDSILQVVNTKDVSLDAVLKKQGVQKDVTFDAYLVQPAGQRDITFDAALQKQGITKDVTFDSHLIKVFGKEIPFDAILVRVQNKDITFDSILQKMFQKDILFDAILQKVFSKDVTFDVILQKVQSKDVNFDTILQTSNQKDVLFDSVLQKALNKDVSFDAILVKTGQKDITFDSVLKKLGNQKDVSFDAHLTLPITVGAKDVTFDAHLINTPEEPLKPYLMKGGSNELRPVNVRDIGFYTTKIVVTGETVKLVRVKVDGDTLMNMKVKVLGDTKLTKKVIMEGLTTLNTLMLNGRGVTVMLNKIRMNAETTFSKVFKMQGKTKIKESVIDKMENALLYKLLFDD